MLLLAAAFAGCIASTAVASQPDILYVSNGAALDNAQSAAIAQAMFATYQDALIAGKTPEQAAEMVAIQFKAIFQPETKAQTSSLKRLFNAALVIGGIGLVIVIAYTIRTLFSQARTQTGEVVYPTRNGFEQLWKGFWCVMQKDAEIITGRECTKNGVKFVEKQWNNVAESSIYQKCTSCCTKKNEEDEKETIVDKEEDKKEEDTKNNIENNNKNELIKI